MKKIICILLFPLFLTNIYASLRPEVSACFKLLSLEMKGYFYNNSDNLPEVSSGFFPKPAQSRDSFSGRSKAFSRSEDCSSYFVPVLRSSSKNSASNLSIGSKSYRNMMGLVVGIGLNFGGTKGYYSYKYSWWGDWSWASNLGIFYFYIGFADKFLFDDVNGIVGEITYGWDFNYDNHIGNCGMLAINVRYLRRLTSHSNIMGGVEMNLLFGGLSFPFVVSPTVAYSYTF